MANLVGDMRTCPTRIDRAPVLFAHRVTRSQCADRQRCGYHKCHTCSYNHAQVLLNGLPVIEDAHAKPAANELLPHPLNGAEPKAKGAKPSESKPSPLRISAV